MVVLSALCDRTLEHAFLTTRGTTVNEWVRRALPALFIATGLLFTGAVAAHAAEGAGSVGNPGVGNGNRVEAPITVPVKICGNSVGVLGHANADAASCGEAAPVKPHKKPTPSMSATATPSTSASPRNGGGDAPPKEELPVTGASVGWLLGASLLLVGGGISMIALARRRVRRGAHAA